MYIHTSSASAYCSFLQFPLLCLSSWLAINRNQYLRNATRMVSEFSIGQYIGHLRCFQSLPSTIYGNIVRVAPINYHAAI